eukprot:2128205-Amphidinium_carterae.1
MWCNHRLLPHLCGAGVIRDTHANPHIPLWCSLRKPQHELRLTTRLPAPFPLDEEVDAPSLTA